MSVVGDTSLWYFIIAVQTKTLFFPDEASMMYFVIRCKFTIYVGKAFEYGWEPCIEGYKYIYKFQTLENYWSEW